jgi:hypothetical protein
MTAVLVVVAIFSIVVLVFIIFAPWKSVRDEPKLDKTAETKLLLHRDPDEPTGEYPRIGSVGTPDDETDPRATYEDLGLLDAEDRDAEERDVEDRNDEDGAPAEH